MLESEFRDWSRRALGSFEERLKAVERRVGEMGRVPPRVRAEGVSGDMFTLAKNLAASVGGGRMTALGIAFVTDDGVAHTGWSNEPFDHFALAGAVAQLWFEVIGGPEAGEEAEAGETPAGEAA